MTTLEHVYFTGAVPLHGRLVREIHRGQPVPRSDGTLGLGWEPHLHAEWQCVVIDDGEGGVALVPLQHVRTMELAAQDVATPGNKSPSWVANACVQAEAARRGRPRTKRLDLVRQ